MSSGYMWGQGEDTGGGGRNGLDAVRGVGMADVRVTERRAHTDAQKYFYDVVCSQEIQLCSCMTSKSRQVCRSLVQVVCDRRCEVHQLILTAD